MRDPAVSVPVLELVVQPVISIEISRLGRRDVHAIETQAIPVVSNFISSLLNMAAFKLRSTGVASTFRNLALPVNEARAFDNVLVGSSVHCLERPDFGQLNALNVSLERLLIDRAVGGTKALKRIKESFDDLPSHTALRRIELFCQY